MTPAQVLRRHGILMILAALFMTLAFAPATLIMLDQPGVSYQNSPFPVRNSPVQPGGDLVLRVERCNRFREPVFYTFARNIIPLDARGEPDLVQEPTVMAAGGSFAPPGCSTFISRLTTIPSTLVPGYYRVEAVTLVQGQWRLFNVPWATEPFIVEALP